MSIFQDTIYFIKKWVPKQKYSDETKYRDDLIDFLRLELNKDNPSLFGTSQRLNISKEDNRHLCDIGINRQVGIELKKDLNSKSQIDRLIGQLIEYKKDYEDVIVLLVGKTNKESLEQLKDRVEELFPKQSSFGSNPSFRVEIIINEFKNVDTAKKTHEGEKGYRRNMITGEWEKDPFLS